MNPRNELLKVIEEAMDHISIGKPEAAMVTLWRVHSALRADDLIVSMRPAFNDNVADFRRSMAQAGHPIQDKLPPIKQRKQQKKRIPPNSVISIPCPRCGAKAGDPCFGFTMAGKNGVPDTSKTIKTFHLARVDKAHKRNKMNQLGEVVVGE
jgi:hypothetical protein